MNKQLKKLSFILIIALLVSQQAISQSTTGRRSTTPPAPTTFDLTITSNVIGANVSINNGAITGVTNFKINTAPGSFVITVSAPGYQSVRKRVNFQGTQTVDFQLQATASLLNVTSNVNGARIQVTGPNNVQGNAPYKVTLTHGNYTVTASADRYDAQTRTVNLQSHENIHFNLKKSMATVQILIPPDSLNKKDVNARSMIKVFDNGTEISSMSFQLLPGQHTIQIVSGGLMTQTTIIAEAGRTYTIQPTLTLIVE